MDDKLLEKLTILFDKEGQAKPREVYRKHHAKQQESKLAEATKARAELTPEKSIKILKDEVISLRTKLAKETLKNRSLNVQFTSIIEGLKVEISSDQRRKLEVYNYLDQKISSDDKEFILGRVKYLLNLQLTDLYQNKEIKELVDQYQELLRTR